MLTVMFGHPAGHRIVAPDAHKALMHLFILAWEGRT
jgi:hypothetical protein